MGLFKLEENPEVFITPRYYDNQYVYIRFSINGESDKRRLKEEIDLRSDKLMIHGTEITESMSQMLYDSLVLRPKQGIVYVNCDGACYIYVKDKGTYRPIDNVVYDWSRFGVVVPNSMNDSLRKKLEGKDEEINKLKLNLSSCEADRLSSKVDLDTSKKEVEELKNQTFELIRKREEMDEKLRDLEDKHASAESELKSTKGEVESLDKNVKELEIKLRVCRKANDDHVAELQRAKDELSQVQSKSTTRKLQIFRCF